MGVTSSILPILRPFLARALRADCAPGPGVLDSTPPRPLILIWMALIPTVLSALTTSIAASIAEINKNLINLRAEQHRLNPDCSLSGIRLTSIWGTLFSVRLHFHASSDSDVSFSAREISYVDEGVVEGSHDVADSEHVFLFVLVCISSWGTIVSNSLSSGVVSSLLCSFLSCFRLLRSWQKIYHFYLVGYY